MVRTTARSIHIKTFGCQMNVYDSDRMRAQLGAKGFSWEPNLRDADVILVNTCAIRDKAEHKVLSLLGQLKGLKDENPDRVIGITGCVGQRLGRSLLQRVPHLDLVLGPDGVDRVGELVDSILATGNRLVETQFDKTEGRQYSQPVEVYQARVSEYLTIMKGCDHFCTYCIVPFVRGREKSRPIPEVIQDVERLVKRGTREVTFLGQNINTYGKGTEDNLAQLIVEADRIEGLERIRYVTSHPRDLGDDLIEQFGKVSKLCPALHLPFQSGSNRILKQMARLYTREEYLGKVEKLRRACPNIALSTDVIVGFPGETDEDFEETISLLDAVKFSGVFLFKYSPRPGTRATAYGSEVSESIKEERFHHAREVSHNYIDDENQRCIGKMVSCLIESMDKKDRFWMGRTLSGKPVHVLNAGPACVGRTVEVEVTQANTSNLKGYFTGAPREIHYV